jgi:tryptophan halogenase
MSDRPIRSICVLGDGIVGLSAAAAFARALPGVRVSIVSAPADPAAPAEQLPATLPSIHRFHAAIGLDELTLVRRGAATHLLGVRFDNWPRGGGSWFHGFGEHGLKAGDIPFHALWHRARLEGRAAPFHHYGAAAVLAAAGKFVHPSDDPASPLGGFLYGLRLDPGRYRAQLIERTAQLPRDGHFAAADLREDGGIAAVQLTSGERVEADLYLDCSGAQALLRSLLDDDFETWSALLPCTDIVVREEPAGAPAPFDRVEAFAGGWRWRSPLPDGTLVIEARTDGGGAALRSGRRPCPWAKNVLAIGEAATVIDPLYGTALHLAQSAILRALELLPGRDCDPLELAEYNRRSLEETDRARDFHALHHLHPEREHLLPASLARTLEQFRRRGRLPLFEAESFDRDSWLAVLLGMGVLPANVDPVTAAIDLDQAAGAMDALAQRLTAAVGRAPPYRELLARMR